MKNNNRTTPEVIKDNAYRFDSFGNGEVLHGKKKNHLPAMGWNSWNAFGSGNTEELTKAMVDKIIELGLDKPGYRYIVLDDGCYKPERVDGRLTSSPERFPSGFKAMADYVHARGLKYGMYNDIGPQLCSGAAVGTCGYEHEDAQSYIDWDVDFLKVDNCYYLWDNATFSDSRNARYVFAPAISGAQLREADASGEAYITTDAPTVTATEAGRPAVSAHEPGLTGATQVSCPIATRQIGGTDYFVNIGTYDGTGPMHSPVGALSGELRLSADIPHDGAYELILDALCGETEGIGSWLQIAVGEGPEMQMFFDELIAWTPAEHTPAELIPPATDGAPDPAGEPHYSEPMQIKVTLTLREGHNTIRIMNHRRQENTLSAYAKLLEGLNELSPDHDIIYSMCEWGKTQPHNWAPKVGDSWRILNDITFNVGSDGHPGSCDWSGGYTNNLTAQYNKCVVMDEFSGLDKGWNDPDMMVIGMDKLNLTQNRTHMAMWCMMNVPLMLGLDLRRINKGDDLYNIITNSRLIALDQDPLGVQAKRIFTTAVADHADTTYITGIHRVDILAKPLADGSVALSFINVSDEPMHGPYRVTAHDIISAIGHRMPAGAGDAYGSADRYELTDLWTGETTENTSGVFEITELEACDNVTYRIRPICR